MRHTHILRKLSVQWFLKTFLILRGIIDVVTKRGRQNVVRKSVLSEYARIYLLNTYHSQPFCLNFCLLLIDTPRNRFRTSRKTHKNIPSVGEFLEEVIQFVYFCQDRGVNIIAVGIGTDVSGDELIKIAMGRHDHVIQTNTIEHLNLRDLQEMIYKTC